MEAMYIEELKSSVNQLMANLESMPVSKGGEFKLQKLKRGHNTSIIDMGQEDENTLSKSDVVLSFTLEVQCIWSGAYRCVCENHFALHIFDNFDIFVWISNFSQMGKNIILLVSKLSAKLHPPKAEL